ncbi:hypothetical protein BC827DRAFT_1271685 [Russula dissimulans]|nr:hypothetical protein BC827DRAFT_1271685 [Russula dissimulans]
MLFARFTSHGLFASLLGGALLRVTAAAITHDPCSEITGRNFVDPANVIDCHKSFPFNETLRQNVLSVVSSVFDFYTFEDFYLNSPPPFQESTTDIRAEIARINNTQYESDYDFNQDLYNFTSRLNDGHTRFFPSCYMTHQYILPAPVVLLAEDVYVAPDSVELLSQFDQGFTRYFEEKGFDWKRLAGAKVINIEGVPAREYIDEIARIKSGNYLDHNVRVNSVVSSYRLLDTVTGNFSQRLGDLAGQFFPTQSDLMFDVVCDSSTIERIHVPFVASFFGNNFTDKASFWKNNCAANNKTNGVDRRLSGFSGPGRRSTLLDPAAHPNLALGLPKPFLPTLYPTNGSGGVIKSYVIPGNKTGVMFVGSFGGNYSHFPRDVEAAMNQFKASGVENLLIDVTNNGGGYVCLGWFLYQFLSGKSFRVNGFQSTSRANPLAQKILKADITKHINSSYSFYAGGNWLFLNGTQMPENYDYYDPSLPYQINDQNQPTSQRFEDLCAFRNVTIPSDPPVDLNRIAIIGNGNCASTCAYFTTLMFELHNTTIATFGGHPDLPIEFKGMAGNQVLEWADLDSEIKTAGLKNDPLAPPDLLVDANMRHNWRTAYSFFDENTPIAYRSEQPHYRFAYTKETYNNPQALWIWSSVSVFMICLRRLANEGISEEKLFGQMYA